VCPKSSCGYCERPLTWKNGSSAAEGAKEKKKISGMDVMAVVDTAPGTVDNVDTNELYTLENHL
jgi:hypothetical protein